MRDARRATASGSFCLPRPFRFAQSASLLSLVYHRPTRPRPAPAGVAAAVGAFREWRRRLRLVVVLLATADALAVGAVAALRGGVDARLGTRLLLIQLGGGGIVGTAGDV